MQRLSSAPKADLAKSGLQVVAGMKLKLKLYYNKIGKLNRMMFDGH
jgi:hypothetical protein